MLTSKNDIIDWLHNNTNLTPSDYDLNGHIVNVQHMVASINHNVSEIKVQFGRVYEFHYMNANLSDQNKLIGLPQSVDSSCFLSQCSMKRLIGLPTTIGRNLFLNNCHELTDLRDLRHVRSIGNFLYISNTNITSGLIAALYVKNLKEIRAQVISNDNLLESINIVNKYLKMERSGSNILKCQDELIDNGYEDQGDI